MDTIIQAQKEVIGKYSFKNWFDCYTWLSGYIGDVKSEVWFLGENPSLYQLEKQSRQSKSGENLQWNASKGDFLLRETITEAGLKDGDPFQNEGWKCYITNIIKEPEYVKERNAKKDIKERKKQAEIWLPVLQKQIELGTPKTFITLGNKANTLFKYMIKQGLNIRQEDYQTHKVYNYSYIMSKPESNGKKRKPADPKRIEEYKKTHC